MGKETLTNGDIAELLAREGDTAEGHTRMALRRASTLAFMWPIEASDLLQQGHSLTELPGVGAFLERKIRQWLDELAPPREIPPERQNFLTLSMARKLLSKKPEWEQAYRGDLQMHTRYSDGSGTVRQMADAAIARGYEYIGVTDHSKGLKIAGGIDEAKLRRQGGEIESVNETLAGQLRVLRSIEVNLNPRGESDMDPASLAELDLVVGSFHSALRQTTDQSERYIAALNNPSVTILGHPRGRVYNYRLGLTADWRKVFAQAVQLDKAIEVDSYPDRQDISADLLEIARSEGVRIAVDTDAHTPEQLGFVELGLAAVLKAKIPPERIVNFMPVEKLLAWASRRGAGKTRPVPKRRRLTPVAGKS